MDSLDTDIVLWNSGLAFERVARWANEVGIKETNHPMSIAAVVNASFSVEMFSKCLSSIITGEYLPTHDVSKIVASLPEEISEQVRTEFRARLSQEEIQKARQFGLTADFQDVLDNWSRVFVESRYWFEEPPRFHSYFFDPLVGALKAVIGHVRENAG